MSEPDPEREIEARLRRLRAAVPSDALRERVAALGTPSVQRPSRAWLVAAAALATGEVFFFGGGQLRTDIHDETRARIELASAAPSSRLDLLLHTRAENVWGEFIDAHATIRRMLEMEDSK
jgi:hypothetical protein